MTQWRKLLRRLVADPRPVSYTYDDLAGVLGRLGFRVATPIDGSHRRFRRDVPDASSPRGTRTVTIGLVDYGRGPVKPEYVKQMVRTLRENELLPEGVESP